MLICGPIRSPGASPGSFSWIASLVGNCSPLREVGLAWGIFHWSFSISKPIPYHFLILFQEFYVILLSEKEVIMAIAHRIYWFLMCFIDWLILERIKPSADPGTLQ